MRNDLSFDAASASVGNESMSFVDVGVAHANNSKPAISVSILPEYDTVGTESSMRTSRVCVTLNAKDLPDDDEDDSARAPVDITVTLDLSGSMQGGKLKLCKQTLDMLLRTLGTRDRFGLVTYNSTAQIAITPQKMTASNKAAAEQKIQSLQAGGGTNLSAAIGLAFQEMQGIQNPNEVCTIFLLTDGLANQGIFDTPGLVELTKNCLELQQITFGATANDASMLGSSWQNVQAAASHQAPETSFASLDPPGAGPNNIPAQVQTSPMVSPTRMFCFGYGTGHNAPLLKALAEAASGSYYFVDGDSNVAAAFGDALGGILSTVAQNVTVTLQMAPEAASTGASIVQVHHDQAIKRENGSFTINVGDFYAEESRDVVATVQLALPAIHLPSPIPHVIASVAYTDTLQKRPVTTKPITCSIARPTGTGLSDAQTHVVLQCFRVLTTETLTRADLMAQRGELVKAQAELRRIDQDWTQQPTAVQSDQRAKELYQDVKELASGLQSRSVYAQRGSKHFGSHVMKHKAQRGTMSSTAAGGVTSPLTFASAYRSPKMAKMSRTFNFGVRKEKASRPEPVPGHDTKPPAQTFQVPDTQKSSGTVPEQQSLTPEDKVNMWSKDEHSSGTIKSLPALLCTLHTVLWKEADWKPVGGTEDRLYYDELACNQCFYRATWLVSPDATRGLDEGRRRLAQQIYNVLIRAKVEFDKNKASTGGGATLP